jgi:hypothetical protein
MIRAYWAALTGIGPVWAARRKVQKARKASISSLFRAMAWEPMSPHRRDVARRLLGPSE